MDWHPKTPGGVGQTAKDCPKSAKAKGRAAQGRPQTKSESKPAEDVKK